MVEEMFNSSRIESGRMEYVYEKVNIVDVCKEVVDILSLRAKEKNLNIAIKYPERFLPEVIADRSKIGEVISNIVDNAIKYTLEGGVTVGFSEEVDFVKVSIKDTGIGIPAGETPYLFAKFSRGKDLSRLNTGGLGLGLSIGRSMMQAMGGKITFESEGKGKGTTFMIYIPTRIKPFQEGQSSSVF
jgi:signal transduction histidine kinase